jgi:fused signal recognition particle receptor
LKEVKAKWGNSLAQVLAGPTEDESFWEKIEETLISGDVGLDLSEKLIADFRKRLESRGSRKIPAIEIFGKQIEEIFKENPLNGAPVRLDGSPCVVLLAGVNGSGKTTTAGKLASQFSKAGKKVVLAAADTFRAAAIEQLAVWSDRSQVRLVSHGPGSDPAAVVFDAIRSAKASNADLVIADTAGRLHTRHNLMEELRKVARVVEREAPGGTPEFLLVLDAVMGQNSFQQARIFGEALPLTGIILTKYDNTSKGGVILSVVHELGLPVRYVGLGERIEDLALFKPAEFAEALLGLNEGALSKGGLPS